jgi:hypothetical protein
MTINEFKAIKDKNKDDDNMTLKEMSYVWFFADIRSDFQNILDESERQTEISLSISLPKGWQPSKEVLDAIEYYKSHSRTPSSGLYQASVAAAQFIEEQLKNPAFLISQEDSKGNKLYKLTDVSRLLKDVPDIMKKLHDARLQVIKEIESSSSLKGNKEKAMFEDGI